jgi:hypothetical protein
MIRKLLTLSAQNALAKLMAPNGFLDSQLARITLPDQLGGQAGGGILASLLRTPAIRDRLTRQVNRAAEKGAAAAAPLIADAIRDMPVQDAVNLLKGNGAGATALLRQHLGDRLITTMLPGISDGLKLLDNDIVTQVLGQATNINFAGLLNDVTRKASDAIYTAIAAEEQAFRADPQKTGDAELAAALLAAR